MREQRDYRGELIELSSIARSLGREEPQPVAICDKGDALVLAQERSIITITDAKEALRVKAALDEVIGRWGKS